MWRFLHPPPLFTTIYAAATVALVSIIALLWAAHLPYYPKRVLVLLNALILIRVAWMWARVTINRFRGGY